MAINQTIPAGAGFSIGFGSGLVTQGLENQGVITDYQRQLINDTVSVATATAATLDFFDLGLSPPTSQFIGGLLVGSTLFNLLDRLRSTTVQLAQTAGIDVEGIELQTRRGNVAVGSMLTD